jgi:hypothetical protein
MPWTLFADLQTAFNQLAQHTVVTGVNFNSTNTDTSLAITLPTGFTRYMVSSLRISGASVSISTATCGLFTAAGGGGVPIVTAATAITVTTASDNTNNNSQSFTINNQNTQSFTATPLFFRVAAAEGSAATANVSVAYVPLP